MEKQIGKDSHTTVCTDWQRQLERDGEGTVPFLGLVPGEALLSCPSEEVFSASLC